MQIRYCDGCSIRMDEDEAAAIGDKFYCPNCAKTHAPARSTPARGTARATPSAPKIRAATTSASLGAVGARAQARPPTRPSDRTQAVERQAEPPVRSSAATFWLLVGAGLLFAGAGAVLMLNARSGDAENREKAEKLAKPDETKSVPSIPLPVTNSGNSTKPVIDTVPPPAKTAETKVAPPEPPREDNTKPSFLTAGDDDFREQRAQRLYTQIVEYEKSGHSNLFELRKKYEQFLLSYASTKPGKEAAAKFKEMPPVPRRPPDNPAKTEPGLEAISYEKKADISVATYSPKDQQPVATKYLDKLDLPSRGDIGRSFGREDNIAAVLTGFVEAPQDGVFKFVLSSDDGSGLYIGEMLVVDNDGYHGMSPPKDATIELSKGKHAIRIVYYQGNGDAGLRLEWEGPGIARQVIPASALSHAAK